MVRGVELDAVPVGSHREVPVLVPDALHTHGPGGPPECAQILRASQDLIERLVVGDGHFVELGDGHVGEMAPRGPTVERLV